MFSEEHGGDPRQRRQQVIGFCAWKRPRSFPSWRKVAIRKELGVGWDRTSREADSDLNSATQEIALRLPLSFSLSNQ